MIYTEESIRDIESGLSGPSVWPKLTGEEQVDLFIFRRPELCYLEALRRIDIRGEPRKVVHIHVRRMITEGKKTTFMRASAKVRTIIPHVVLEDREDDVREFLREIRKSIKSIMPDKPDHRLTLGLIMYSSNHTRIVSTQERWV